MSKHAEFVDPALSHVPTQCRVWKRFNCSQDATCYSGAASEVKKAAWPASVRDISAGGAGLVLARCIEPGTQLVIDLSDSTSDQPALFLCCVANTTSLPEGNVVAGLLIHPRIEP